MDFEAQVYAAILRYEEEREYAGGDIQDDGDDEADEDSTDPLAVR